MKGELDKRVSVRMKKTKIETQVSVLHLRVKNELVTNYKKRSDQGSVILCLCHSNTGTVPKFLNRNTSQEQSLMK